ncbi:MAG: hypothetical protein ABIT96_10280 [Ferruginibacter sp.]
MAEKDGVPVPCTAGFAGVAGAWNKAVQMDYNGGTGFIKNIQLESMII